MARLASISSGRSAESASTSTSLFSTLMRPPDTAAVRRSPLGRVTLMAPGIRAAMVLLWPARMPMEPSTAGTVRLTHGPS